MPKPPLATAISSLLVSTFIVTPTMLLAADSGYRGTVEGVADKEEVRRAEYERRGREAIESGDAAMKDKDYEKATALYKGACDIIPNAPLTQSLYDDALHDFCEASTKLAEQRIAEG